MCGEDLGPLNKQINQDTGFYQFGERLSRFRLPSGGFLRWEMGGSGTNGSNELLRQPRPTQVLTKVWPLFGCFRKLFRKLFF